MDVLALVDPATGLVHTDALRAAGVDRHAVSRWLATGLLRRVCRGSFVASAVWAGLDDRGRHLLVARCALQRLPGAALAGTTAAVVHELPLPPRALPASPVLLRPRSAARPERGSGGSTTSRRAWLPPEEVTVLDELPVTTLPRTVVDLARSTTTPWALAAFDAALARTGVARQQLVAAADRQPRAPGHRRAVFCAASADPLAESALESAGRAVLLERGFPPPRLQVWVSGRAGDRYRLDMLFEEWWTVIEVDGRVKYADAAGAESVWAEKRRQDDLSDVGLEVVRFVATDLRAPDAFARRVLRAVDRAHTRRGLVPPSLPLLRLGTPRSGDTP